MSSKETGLFGSEYWNLHRNSLFFSTLALVISAPGVDFTELAISGLKFGEVGGGAILFAAIVAATYCVTAFVLEWLQEARPYLRTRGAAHHSALLARLEWLDAAKELYSKHAFTLEAIKINAASFEAAVYAKLDKRIDQIQMKYIDKFVAETRTDRTSLEFQGTQDKLEGFSGAMRAELIEICAQTRDESGELTGLADKIRDDLAAIQAATSRLKFPMMFSDFGVKLRVLGFGLGFPVALYLVALAHSIGAFGYVAWASWIFHAPPVKHSPSCVSGCTISYGQPLRREQ